MKQALVTMKSVTPVSFSMRYDHVVARNEGETVKIFEERTWRHKAYADHKGQVYIPSIWFKKALDWTAKQCGVQIEGKGKKTWMMPFKSGTMCLDNLPLGIKIEDIECVRLHQNSRGSSGGKLDVMRIFPIVPEWEGTVTFAVLNDAIDLPIFKYHMIRAGQLCGLGRWAPRVGGMNGRFEVTNIDWQDEALPRAA